jgi:hypothetical protein
MNKVLFPSFQHTSGVGVYAHGINWPREDGELLRYFFKDRESVLRYFASRLSLFPGVEFYFVDPEGNESLITPDKWINE